MQFTIYDALKLIKEAGGIVNCSWYDLDRKSYRNFINTKLQLLNNASVACTSLIQKKRKIVHNDSFDSLWNKCFSSTKKLSPSNHTTNVDNIVNCFQKVRRRPQL